MQLMYALAKKLLYRCMYDIFSETYKKKPILDCAVNSTISG